MLGPIFRVEAVTTARRSRYFVLRFLYAVVLLLLLWSQYASTGAFYRAGGNVTIQQAATVSAGLFRSFASLQIFAIIAVGPALAVGSISAERERRTIEYLFATDLSNAEIVMGKTFARLALLVKLALVGLPIFFIARLLGGVPADMLVGSFLIAASAAVCVTAISICISVWSRTTRDATLRVYLLLFVSLICLPVGLQLAAWVSRSWTPLQGLLAGAAQMLVALNPLLVWWSAVGNQFTVTSGFDFAGIWSMMAWHAGISAFCLGAAVAAVRRVHLRAAGGSKRRSSAPAARARRSIMARLAWRPAIGGAPMVWKESFAGAAGTRLGVVGVIAAGIILLTFLGVSLYGFLAAWADFSQRDDYDFYSTMVSSVVGVGAVLVLGARAAGLVTQEKQSDTWLSLLATPLTGREIMLGKLAGNLYAARWPLAMIAFAWLLGLLLNGALIFPALFTVVTFLLCVWFATALGLFFSLRTATTLRAMGWTLATLLFLAGGYFMCCCPVAAVGPIGSDAEAMGLAPCYPYLLAFPGASSKTSFNREPVALIAYLTGVAGYALAAAIFTQTITADFDSHVGRTTKAEKKQPQPALPGDGQADTSEE